jgi:hypothetical protein
MTSEPFTARLFCMKVPVRLIHAWISAILAAQIGTGGLTCPISKTRAKEFTLLSRSLISQDAPPSHDHTAASWRIPLTYEETNHTHFIELYDLTRNKSLGRYEIPVPVIVQTTGYTEIPIPIPTSTLQIGFDLLPSLHRALLPNSPTCLNIDCFLYQEGRYEIRQWAQGREESVRQLKFTVSRK